LAYDVYGEADGDELQLRRNTVLLYTVKERDSAMPRLIDFAGSAMPRSRFGGILNEALQVYWDWQQTDQASE